MVCSQVYVCDNMLPANAGNSVTTKTKEHGCNPKLHQHTWIGPPMKRRVTLGRQVSWLAGHSSLAHLPGLLQWFIVQGARRVQLRVQPGLYTVFPKSLGHRRKHRISRTA